jgi:cellobiose phosphorylase
VQATLDGLRVSRELPEGWDGFELMRRYRGAEYHISVRRAAGGERAGLTVDGKPHGGDVLPILPAGSTARVEVRV